MATVVITETVSDVVKAASVRRRLTSLEAVERRRLSRRAAALIKRVGSSQAETLIRQRMESVVKRMLRRYVPRERLGEALLHEYDYWSLRRLGYDVYAEDERTVVGGRWTGKWLDEDRTVKELIAPEATKMWLWWRRLHWKTRLKTAGASRYILKGLEAAQASSLITNPAFEVVHDFAGEDFLTDEAG